MPEGTRQRKPREPKPSLAELLTQTERGGRVFLFTYPENPVRPNGCLMPTEESSEEIVSQLLDIPGAKTVEGPFFNGTIAIAIEDAKGAEAWSDDEVRQTIACIVHCYWRPDVVSDVDE